MNRQLSKARKALVVEQKGREHLGDKSVDGV
jgi:hypothetical protein